MTICVAEMEPAGPVAPRLKHFLEKVGREPICIVELDQSRGLLYQPAVEDAKKFASVGTDAIVRVARLFLAFSPGLWHNTPIMN